MNLLQLNKFSDLHNGKNVIFCKTEYLQSEFKKISKIKNEVILISGNSDLGIDPCFTRDLPDNIIAWYCQNNLTDHEKLRSIPIGLENTVPNKRRGHGIAWPHAIHKSELLDKLALQSDKLSPTKFIYANFNVQTNLAHRLPIKELCEKSTFITWAEPNLPYDDLLSDILDHEAVICPAGNGIDTHRLYEILYCGRVPVTIKVGNYPLYTELYEKLPIVIIDRIDDLKDEGKLKEKVAIEQQKAVKMELLDFNYWKALIMDNKDHETTDGLNYLSKFFNYVCQKKRIGQ